MSEIVEIIGRWARLSNGDLVTPVPPFHEFGYDSFNKAIADFQSDPAAALARGIVQRISPKRPAVREELGHER